MALVLDLLLIAGVGVALGDCEHVFVEDFQVGGILGAQVDVMELVELMVEHLGCSLDGCRCHHFQSSVAHGDVG